MVFILLFILFILKLTPVHANLHTHSVCYYSRAHAHM